MFPFMTGDIEKLLLAALLGGLIGLERESKHRPAGLRTNLFICMGAAMFTLLSDQLAVIHIGDHTRIAAQIIPGIGFIGAGSIIHARGDLVTGITSAATLFVVASVGMAVGGGLYMIAIFATLLILAVLLLLGFFERFVSLKIMVYAYEVTGKSAEEASAQVNEILEPLHFIMHNVQVAPTPRHVRVHFECEGTRKNQGRVLRGLRESNAFESVAALGPVQAE
jgi:putative Mg2+ transporter-C (MgtC) family protein